MITWNTPNNTYGNSRTGKIGSIVIFTITYDGCRSANEPEKERLACLLPGIKSIIGHFKTKEEAEAKAESVLKFWLTRSGLRGV